jgi:hypothetical protein
VASECVYDKIRVIKFVQVYDDRRKAILPGREEGLVEE